ncbi:MAG: 4-hydroxythreonine-4-phosphate dehydrogenase PdxA [Candidatus Caenarcaniphilales bacterium]|nr:4-hydroxythreonine-4-phosphate dehydrogenase PdxA [Candidatus Caenarcaniphilales bacterium]
MTESQKPILAITYGDPEGIGVEIIASLCSSGEIANLPCKLILFGDQAVFKPNQLPANLEILSDQSINFDPGSHSYLYLDRAIESCLRGQCQGLITGPIAKDRWVKAGYTWSGQTELLADRTSTQPEMLFMTSNPSWRILLLTRHMPLRDIAAAINFERLQSACLNLRNFLSHCEGIAMPRIALAGLNPHAGDGGACGREEIDHWQEWCTELGVEGPFSPDSLWVEAGKAYLAGKTQTFDAYIAPYHDQILPLVKLTTNFKAVNVSIGLPFIRTSPDHGTAFDLVGSGKADPLPFLEAIELCLKLTIAHAKL